ncbi:hypothetical protein U1Q18_034615 [Sarracenia purpurea var. burkii]
MLELRGRRLTLQPRQPIRNTFFMKRFNIDLGRCSVLRTVREDALLRCGYSRGSFGFPKESYEVAPREVRLRRARLQISEAGEGMVETREAETREFDRNASVVATNLLKSSLRLNHLYRSSCLVILNRFEGFIYTK